MGSHAAILGYPVFAAIFVAVIMLQPYQVIVQSKYPGTGIIFSHMKRYADATRFAASYMHNKFFPFKGGIV